LGTPIGIIVISFLDARIDLLLFIPETFFGLGDTIPFFGTNEDTDMYDINFYISIIYRKEEIKKKSTKL